MSFRRWVASYNLTPKRIALRLLWAFFCMYAVTFAIQRYLIFPAYMADARGKMQSPAAYHLAGFSETRLTASDGVRLAGWAHAPRGAMPVIIYFPGNAMHLGARVQRFDTFAHVGYGLFALSYRGYGLSEGSPSEEGLYRDARAALGWVKQHYPDAPVLLYGESLGSGVAVQMAKEQPVSGLVLQSAYTSIADVAAETYWFMPGTHALVLYPFDSLSKIAFVHCPVLVIHGDKDSVIPWRHGQTLFKNAKQPKRFVLVPGAGHVNVPDTVIVNAMRSFFEPMIVY